MKKTFVLLSCMALAQNLQAQNPTFQNYEQAINEKQSIIKMVAIPAGKFLMGSPATEKNREKDEGPQVEINVEPFWMSATEITHDQFAAFRFQDKDLNPNIDAMSRPTAQYIDLTWGMGKEGGFPANSMQPFTAIAYCKWLWKKTGIFYRLPTEAEWEYAAKEGQETILGEAVNSKNIQNYAWLEENSDGKYHEVGKKLPNKFGLYDMIGNVAEWTMDMYDANYYAKLKDMPSSLYFTKREDFRSYHTARGGGFKTSKNEVRLSDRIEQTEDWNRRDPQIPRSKWWITDGESVGFRIVRPISQPSVAEIELFFKDALEKE
jgi:formylglycine-generating enzyme required for sulfatase activity